MAYVLLLIYIGYDVLSHAPDLSFGPLGDMS